MRSSSIEGRGFWPTGTGAWVRLGLVVVLGAAALAAPSVGLAKTGAIYTDSQTVEFTVVPSAPATTTSTTATTLRAAAAPVAAAPATTPPSAPADQPTASPSATPQPTATTTSPSASPTAAPAATTAAPTTAPTWPHRLHRPAALHHG